MKIEITGGYIELYDYVTHGAEADYQTTLFQGTDIKGDGGNINNWSKAAEVFTLALIKRVVQVKDGVETEVQPSSEWVRTLDQRDYKKLEKAALELKKAADGKVKK